MEWLVCFVLLFLDEELLREEVWRGTGGKKDEDW